jgi:hypothetical protein
MRDVDVGGNRGDGERTGRIEVSVVLLVPGVAITVANMCHRANLVRAERQLQAIRLRRKHETDRQERARYQ